MKSLTRREMLFEVFSKDTLKSLFGAYKEFTKAQGEAEKVASSRGKALRGSGGKTREHFDKFHL